MFEEKFLTYAIKTTANLAERPELDMDFKENFLKLFTLHKLNGC